MKVVNNVWHLFKSFVSSVRHVYKRETNPFLIFNFCLYFQTICSKKVFGFESLLKTLFHNNYFDVISEIWSTLMTNAWVYLLINVSVLTVINHITLFKPYISLDFFVENPLMKHISVIWTHLPSMFVKTGGVQSQIDCGPIYLRRSNH